jgi:hypothetical protein
MHIGIAGSAVNALAEIFHPPDRGGKTYRPHAGGCGASAPRSEYKASTTIISSSGLRWAKANSFSVTGAAAPAADFDDPPAVAQARVEGTGHWSARRS